MEAGNRPRCQHSYLGQAEIAFFDSGRTRIVAASRRTSEYFEHTGLGLSTFCWMHDQPDRLPGYAQLARNLIDAFDDPFRKPVWYVLMDRD